MADKIHYIKLFRISILHNYFLNKGEEKYSEMDENDKNGQLSIYNVQNFASIQPSFQTKALLKNYRLLFKNNSSGFYVGVRIEENGNNSPTVPLDGNLGLMFLVKINDPHFYNFSDIDDEIAKSIFYFSNKTLVGVNKTIPLSGSNDELIDFKNFILPDAIFTTKIEDLSKEEIDIRNKVGQLTLEEKKNLFGVIRIFMKPGNTKDILDSSNNVPDNYVQFCFKINNRETIWQYMFEETQVVADNDPVFNSDTNDSKIVMTQKKYPLTHAGFISLKLNGKKLPNPGSELIFPVDDKIFSKIYM